MTTGLDNLYFQVDLIFFQFYGKCFLDFPGTARYASRTTTNQHLKVTVCAGRHSFSQRHKSFYLFMQPLQIFPALQNHIFHQILLSMFDSLDNLEV